MVTPCHLLQVNFFKNDAADEEINTKGKVEYEIKRKGEISKKYLCTLRQIRNSNINVSTHQLPDDINFPTCFEFYCVFDTLGREE